MRIDSIIIEETGKAYDSECIYRYGTCVFALTDRTFCVYKQIHKKFEFFQKTLAFLYFMVYTKKACDIDSYEA